MGPTAQLDDYPYVHIMRCIDDELAKRGKSRAFFHAADRPFQDPRHWGTLIQLINEDYADLQSHKTENPATAANHLLDRIDRAAKKVGAEALGNIDRQTRAAVADAIEPEARKMLKERNENNSQDLTGKTIVIEFARGGAHGSSMPLPEPFGYKYSLSQLSAQVLGKASILYVWVTPEESRRKNQERADPNNPGSILHHGVPIEVMMNDYGVDDMDYLENQASIKGTVEFQANGKKYNLPIGRFDNRVDKTSFIRNEKSQWKTEQVKAVHNGLKSALDVLANYKHGY